MEIIKTTNRLVIMGISDDVRTFVRKAESSFSHLDLQLLLPMPKHSDGTDAQAKWQQTNWGNEGLTDVWTSTVQENSDASTVTYRFNVLNWVFNYPHVPDLNWLMQLSKRFPSLQFILFSEIDDHLLTIQYLNSFVKSWYWSAP
jgi:hypothetical protein